MIFTVNILIQYNKIKNMKKKYVISNLDKTQIKMIADALECHSRMRCGQIGRSFLRPIDDELAEHHAKTENYHEKIQKVDGLLNQIREEIWYMPDGAGLGIGYDPRSDLGYEMYKEILSLFEMEEEEECKREGMVYRSCVHTGNPLKLTNLDRIKVEVEEVDGEETELDDPDVNKKFEAIKSFK